MKEIVFRLNENSIQKAIDELANYKKELERKCNRVAELLAQRGVKDAKVNIQSLDAIFTGELINSIHVEKGKESGVFYVVADSEHAVFVEFGTGYVGADNPYPFDLPSGYNYKTGKQLLANARKGIYGWVYQGKDGNFYFTEGMESRPFMHNTLVQLQNEALNVVREVFR